MAKLTLKAYTSLMKDINYKLNKNSMKTTGITIMLCAFAGVTARAQNISALDTGAGSYAINNGAVLVDPNWTVTLLGTDPAGQTPPGGIPTGAAYLVPNSAGFPFDGFWLANSATSSWITYATPTPVGTDETDGTYQYQVTFTAANSGALGINFLGDNLDSLSINGEDLGSNPGHFSAWLATPLTYDVSAGTIYTVDLDVLNNARGSSGDPTGARVEFSGNINIGAVPGSVPEESSLLVNAALLALPFGAGIYRKMRKFRTAV
jgi:hypothetical protein